MIPPLLSTWLSVLLAAAPAAAASLRHERHVVVISIDGMAAYSLADPSIPLPTLRALARAGVMAEAMTPVNPTVTWPNHTTLVTGVMPEKHGLLYNGLPVRATPGSQDPPVRIEPHVDKAQLVLAPTVYDAAYAAGLTTAEVDWVAIENAATITWSFSEYSKPEAPLAREMVKAGVVSEGDLELFAKAPITFRDEIWTRAAEFLIARHKPNLLLFHLLSSDTLQHQTGARSLSAQASLVLADARVARLVEACRQAGILAKTTFVVVSDHGFHTFKRRIRGNVLLRDAGLGEEGWAIAEGGTAMVYLSGPVDRAKTIEAVKTGLGSAEGVASVLTPADFPGAGYPSPATNGRMADVVIAAKDGFGFIDGTDGPAVEDVPGGANTGGHGYLNTSPDMRAVFIASGAGVRAGVSLGVVTNLDVAPTIAAWLGVPLPTATGKPLTAIIR